MAASHILNQEPFIVFSKGVILKMVANYPKMYQHKFLVLSLRLEVVIYRTKLFL